VDRRFTQELQAAFYVLIVGMVRRCQERPTTLNIRVMAE